MRLACLRLSGNIKLAFSRKKGYCLGSLFPGQKSEGQRRLDSGVNPKQMSGLNLNKGGDKEMKRGSETEVQLWKWRKTPLGSKKCLDPTKRDSTISQLSFQKTE